MTPNDHFPRLARLLELESRAEMARILEAAKANAGVDGAECLVGLVVIEESSGLGGRFLMTLARRNRSQLPWNRFEPGSPVVLSASGGKGGGQRGDGWRGVVCERTR